MEDFEILQVGILRIDVELDASHGDIEVDTVEDLAESRSALETCKRLLVRGATVGRLGARKDQTYPVPHCSTLVIFNWSRLLSHATSSCLQRPHCQNGGILHDVDPRIY